MISKKKLKNDLNHLWNVIRVNIEEDNKLFHEINKKINEIEEIKTKINKIEEIAKKITDDHNKKIQMLIDSENTVRLAINKIAEELIKKNILTTKKEKKTNEWTKSKSNNRKQSVPKHSKPRFIQK